MSDPQFGKNHLFGGNGLTAADSEADSLLGRLHQDLAHLARADRLRPDLIVVTGDLAPDKALLAVGSSSVVEMTGVAVGTVLRVLRGHTNSVTAVAFSPDGTLIATTSSDHTARTWDPATGDHIATFTGHGDAVTAVAFSPDGTLIATASNDTARTWDGATFGPRAVLRGHDGAVTAVAFSPDSTLIATACADNTVRIWDAAVGTLLATLVPLPDDGYATFLTDGRYKIEGNATDSVWWAIRLVASSRANSTPTSRTSSACHRTPRSCRARETIRRKS